MKKFSPIEPKSHGPLKEARLILNRPDPNGPTADRTESYIVIYIVEINGYTTHYFEGGCENIKFPYCEFKWDMNNI